MKSSIKWGLAFLLPWSTAIYATKPVPGPYAGIMLGASYAPGLKFHFINPVVTNPSTGAVISYTGGHTADTGDVSYNAFGNFAGMFGYRICQYRVEAELLFNSSPITKISANDITITRTTSSSIYLKGQTNFGAVMVNGFYDFYTPGVETSSVIPYVGVGIGYGSLRNSFKLYTKTPTTKGTYIPGTNISSSGSTPAAQGIIGLSYFLDDFAALSLDYRYLSTKTVQPFDSRYTLNSINLTFSGALDFG